MAKEQSNNLTESNIVISEEDSFLEDCEKWSDLSDERKQILKDDLRSASKNLWFKICHKKVHENDEIWLKNFAECKDKDSLPLPFASFPNGESDNKRKYSAMCLANCALAAIRLKNTNSLIGKDEQNNIFIECIKRGIIFWQKTSNLNLELEVKEFSVTNFPQTSAESKQFLDTIFEDLSNKYSNYEILPIRDLIYCFLTGSKETAEKQEFLSEAKFPVVDTQKNKAKICLLEVERYSNGNGRLYRDPFEMSSSVVDETFQRSIRNSFDYIRTQYGEECDNCDFRWRASDWIAETQNGKRPVNEGSLSKQSVGLAAAVAFSQSVNLENFGDNYVFTGIVNRDSGKVEKVGSYIDKLEVLPAGFTFFMPSEDYPKLEHLIKDYDIKPAESFVDVTRKIQEIQRNKEEIERERKRKIRLIATAAIVTLLLVFIWVRFERQNAANAQENEKIARAGQQAAEAGRLAAEGYKRLAEGDKNTAQTLFAKSISLDDRSEYRSGLLSASFDESIKTKLAWTEEIDDFENPEHFSLQSIAIDSTGEMLAVSSSNGQDIQILSTLDGTKTSDFSFEHPVTALALSPNGKFLAVRTKDSKLSVLEIDSKKTYFELNMQTAYDEMIGQEKIIIDLLSFNSDGTYLATNSGSSEVIVLDVETKQIVKKFNHAGEFHDDPQPVLMRILTSSTGKQSGLPDAQINSLAFSQDNYLAYGFKNNPILIRSLKDNSVNKMVLPLI